MIRADESAWPLRRPPGGPCRTASRPPRAARYVARRMSSARELVFEAHYLVCGRCQEEIRLAVALRLELPRPRLTPSGSAPS